MHVHLCVCVWVSCVSEWASKCTFIWIYFVAVHTIAAVKVKEDYNGIAESYADCFETINEAIANPHVTIYGINYNLEFFLCCDYKVSDIQYNAYVL